MKKILLLLAVLILAGCGNAEPAATEITAAAELTETVPETTVSEMTDAEPTEPEIPAGPVWLPVYHTDKGKAELHCLVKNETMGNLSVESMHTEYSLNGEVVKEKDYSKKELKNFLWRPFNELDLPLAASTLLIVDDYPSPDGFDHAIVTITTVGEQNVETVLTYNFTADEGEVTPSTLTDNWELGVSWLVDEYDGWNWDHEVSNDTEKVLTLKYAHQIHYDNGIPVAAGTAVPSQMGQLPKEVEKLQPGTKAVDTSGITGKNRNYNQREVVYEYHDDEGNVYFQKFHFVYEEAIGEEEHKRLFDVFDEASLPEGLVRLGPEGVKNALGPNQYSEAEIRQMIEENLTLDEVADKISTVADAFQYMNLKGFHYGMGQLKGFYVNEDRWEATLSAESVFGYNQGACGDGSNLLNAILRDDYEEQGFVQQVDGKERHAFNWIKQDGVYYFVDWTLQVFTGNYDRFDYFVFAAEELQPYTEYYIDRGVTSDGVNYDIYLLYMYPREGDQYPFRIARNKTPFERTLPAEIENQVTVLYNDLEKCLLKFQDGPEEALWPK